jgi:SAM-dependent methyltransferase
MRHKAWIVAVVLAAASAVMFASRGYWRFDAGPNAVATLDVPYVQTPRHVVDWMLRLADLDSGDLLYDLGSGDGRIVIAAAARYGARGVGIDLDPERVRESRVNAERAGVADLVRFVRGDLFEADLREATAVTLYLNTAVNLKLRPKLLRELRPGTPVVSHSFDMGEWEPDETLSVDRHTVFLWIVPAKAAGRWSVSVEAEEESVSALWILEQDFQVVSGTGSIAGERAEVESGRLRGEAIELRVRSRNGGTFRSLLFEGRVRGDSMEGSLVGEGDRPVKARWTARRVQAPSAAMPTRRAILTAPGAAGRTSAT